MATGYTGIGGSASSMSDGKAKVVNTSRGGKSSIVKGPKTDVFEFGPTRGTKAAGTGRFDVTERSLNKSGSSRRM